MTEYVKFAKIERAKVLLKSTDQTVQGISDALAFGTRNYFSFLFDTSDLQRSQHLIEMIQGSIVGLPHAAHERGKRHTLQSGGQLGDAPKAPGSHNFMNEPETWNTLEHVRELAAPYGLTLLPEIHASYEEKTYEKVANYGYLTYDFFLPGLLIDAIEQKDGTTLAGWANELIEKHIVTVNMLGCHDGIPLLDLRGLLPEERIAGLIDLIVERGGFVKNLHGQKNVYYQVNATYYSALGEDDRKMLVARAIQLFMPGKPQVWYLDLFAGKNDHEAVAKAGEGGHKEINRTNLTIEQIHSALTQDVVKKQIELLRFRKSSRAFTSNAKISVISNKNNMHFIWQGNTTAELSVDFTTMSYEVKENGYIMMKG